MLFIYKPYSSTFQKSLTNHQLTVIVIIISYTNTISNQKDLFIDALCNLFGSLPGFTFPEIRKQSTQLLYLSVIQLIPTQHVTHPLTYT